MNIRPVIDAGSCDEIGCHEEAVVLMDYGEEFGDKTRYLCPEHEFDHVFQWLVDTELKCPTCGTGPIEVGPVEESIQAYAECLLGHVYFITQEEGDGRTTGLI